MLEKATAIFEIRPLTPESQKALIAVMKKVLIERSSVLQRCIAPERLRKKAIHIAEKYVLDLQELQSKHGQTQAVSFFRTGFQIGTGNRISCREIDAIVFHEGLLVITYRSEFVAFSNTAVLRGTFGELMILLKEKTGLKLLQIRGPQ